jgi:hypothetical protein
MAYVLPRTFIVLMGWGMTCALIANVWPHVDPLIYTIAAVSWALAGITCFGYLYKLRREEEAPQESNAAPVKRSVGSAAS